MCFSSKSDTAPTPAAPPPPPAEPPDEQAIGGSRREESRENFGRDAPTYRVDRNPNKVTPNPDRPIRM